MISREADTPVVPKAALAHTRSPLGVGVGTRTLSALLLALSFVSSSAAPATPPPSGKVQQGPTGDRTRLGATAPGSAPMPATLAMRLWAAYQSRGTGYVPRTEHLRADGKPLYVNRLILEDSPYLIQHAHNPVDWYPWGPEAFEVAEREGKPIFLSIGYSTCHWCHVMEKESFEDEETARLMNQWFVNIKVDREQRPDVDEVYMTAVQLITGRGGWPMSSFLTSDGRPFFGGTYFPRDSFKDLLAKAAAAWRDQRALLMQQAAAISERVAVVNAATGETVEIGSEILEQAVTASLRNHDEQLGGFSPAPKFPHEPELLFLLAQALRTGDGSEAGTPAQAAQAALAAVATTLDRMARGGIYDQVGGGFHRYSVDAEWLVPHFEKMLYNQAHLARAYLEASRLTGDELLERVARQTLDYVLRDMTSPAGAFYSATDADSEDREGEFFVWTPAELREALGPADAELAIRVFGVSESGNFEGKNILHLPAPLGATAAASGLSLPTLLERLDRIRARLYQVREERIHPLRDEKIVTAWNAMMITTLARAGEALEEARYLDAARRAAAFLWAHNRRPDGRLWRAHLDGTSSVEASQNDYAYLAEALATLYDVTGEGSYLEKGVKVSEVMIERFWDAGDSGDAAGSNAESGATAARQERAPGGFFMSEDDHGGRLPVRPKDAGDGAIPSGNSVAVRALAMLAARSGRAAFRQTAETTVAAFSKSIRRHPTGFAYMLLGLDELLHGAAGSVEYGARGVVRAEADAVLGALPGEVEVRLQIADGWHVNSSRPLQDNLVGTTMAVAGDRFALKGIGYPAGEVVSLGFQTEPLSVYRGKVSIRATLEDAGRDANEPADAQGVLHLLLGVQACDDERCLRPETLVLELPVPR